jgi:hypothetical protein
MAGVRRVVVSLDYSCLRKKLVSDALNGHDIRSMTLSLTRRNAWAQFVRRRPAGALKLSQTVGHCHRPMGGAAREEYKRGGQYGTLRKQ